MKLNRKYEIELLCYNYYMSRVTVIREGGRAGGGAVYGLGFLGALIFYWQHAITFGAFVMGLLKALVWPALLVYKAIEFFKL